MVEGQKSQEIEPREQDTKVVVNNETEETNVEEDEGKLLLMDQLKHEGTEIRIQRRSHEALVQLHQVLRQAEQKNLLKSVRFISETTGAEYKQALYEEITKAYLLSGVTEEDKKRFENVVEELVENAVRANKRSKEGRYVDVRWGNFTQGKNEEKKRMIGVYVADEGEGFVLEEVPNGKHLENILNGSGRGLLIVNDRLQQENLDGRVFYYCMSETSKKCRELFLSVKRK